MQTIQINLFKFNELSEKAKKKAIESNHDINVSYQWWDSVLGDAENIAKILGLSDMNVFFSGFYSQGDGASFSAAFQYENGMTSKIKDYAPADTELHRIAKSIFSAHKKGFYKLSGKISCEGRYCHEYAMRIDIISHETHGYDFDFSVAEDELLESYRDLARWIYRQLQEEYEYRTGGEAIADALEDMDYDFTADGARYD